MTNESYSPQTKKQISQRITWLFLFLAPLFVLGQSQSKRAVFLGNSYTNFNNLPALVASLAASGGDSLYHEKATPGGFTLQGHTTNPTSINKITDTGWDFMVLQEQSQRPSFPLWMVQADVFPYARILDSLYTANNRCGETVFFMTWGRQNGDANNCASWPPVCTYEGMDSLLHRRYRMMADSSDAILSPVGALWHYLRDNHPSIQLYASDGSHPSQIGSYAAACSFYTVMFRKDPAPLSYTFNLDTNVAGIIRRAARDVIYDSLLYWNVGKYDVQATFQLDSANNADVFFSADVQNADGFFWEIDGVSDSNQIASAPIQSGHWYQIKLTAYNGCDTIVINDSIPFAITSLPEIGAHSPWQIFPNPATDFIQLESSENGAWQFKLIDSFGRVIHSKQVQAGEQLKLPSVPQGVYWVQLSTEDNTHSYPLLINRR